MTRAVIIVGGGSGKRMGGNVPKQFLPLSGKPVLWHSIQRFREYDPEIRIILVLSAQGIALWKNLCIERNLPIDYDIIEGGEERYYSVKNGLSLIRDESFVAIHDGVRPLVTTKLIQKCFTGAAENGTAIPVIPVTDTVRRRSGKSVDQIQRDDLLMVQTPQVFRSEIVKSAYDQPFDPSFTDDASVVEASGVPVSHAEGERWNIKITIPPDMIVAGALLESRL